LCLCLCCLFILLIIVVPYSLLAAFLNDLRITFNRLETDVENGIRDIHMINSHIRALDSFGRKHGAAPWFCPTIFLARIRAKISIDRSPFRVVLQVVPQLFAPTAVSQLNLREFSARRFHVVLLSTHVQRMKNLVLISTIANRHCFSCLSCSVSICFHYHYHWILSASTHARFTGHIRNIDCDDFLSGRLRVLPL
jgi:hypothetical protein